MIRNLLLGTLHFVVRGLQRVVSLVSRISAFCCFVLQPCYVSYCGALRNDLLRPLSMRTPVKIPQAVAATREKDPTHLITPSRARIQYAWIARSLGPLPCGSSHESLATSNQTNDFAAFSTSVPHHLLSTRIRNDRHSSCLLCQ